MIYRQPQSGKREKRRNICMSSMISDLLLHAVGGALFVYVNSRRKGRKKCRRVKSTPQSHFLSQQ